MRAPSQMRDHLAVRMEIDGGPFVLRLDYLSCVLTVVSTVLIGRKHWEGWVLAGINSVVCCVIGIKTLQWGFIPANLFCIFIYALNVRSWRKAEVPSNFLDGAELQMQSGRQVKGPGSKQVLVRS